VDAKPSDLFIGVIDVFAVLLPGAILAFLGLDFARDHVFGHVLPEIRGEAAGWVAFGLASYLLGHFVFLAGSRVDRLYDRWRKRYHPDGTDRAYLRAKSIKQKALGDSDGDEIVNTFKWAKANVQLRHPPAAGAIQRLEADSKFFRSLVVLLFVTGTAFATQGMGAAAGACVVMMFLAFWRYCDQRWKSTELAYTYLIALDTMPAPAADPAAAGDEG
jgi:hypothetical protein